MLNTLGYRLRSVGNTHSNSVQILSGGSSLKISSTSVFLNGTVYKSESFAYILLIFLFLRFTYVVINILVYASIQLRSFSFQHLIYPWAYGVQSLTQRSGKTPSFSQ